MTHAPDPLVHSFAADGGAALFGAPAVPSPADPAVVAMARDRLDRAERPLAVAGGPGWSDADADALRRFAETRRVPVCCPGPFRDVFDHESSCFAGCLGGDADPALLARLARADLVIAVEAAADLPALSGERIDLPRAALEQLADPVDVSASREAWLAEANAEAMAWIQPSGFAPGALDVGYVLGWLRDRLPTDAVVAADGLGLPARAPRHLLFRRPGRFVAAPSAANGFAVPAAVAARMVLPKRVVLALTDADGALECGAALAEAAEAGTAPLILAVNDRADTDVARAAEDLGAFAVTVNRTRDFVPAFWDAMWSGRPAVIELRTA